MSLSDDFFQISVSNTYTDSIPYRKPGIRIVFFGPFDGDLPNDILTFVTTDTNELDETIPTLTGGRKECANPTIKLHEELKGNSSLFYPVIPEYMLRQYKNEGEHSVRVFTSNSNYTQVENN